MSLCAQDQEIFAHWAGTSRKPVTADCLPFVTSAAGGREGEAITRFAPKLAGIALVPQDVGSRPLLREYPEPLGFAARTEEGISPK
jgi:hypothetical protein